LRLAEGSPDQIVLERSHDLRGAGRDHHSLSARDPVGLDRHPVIERAGEGQRSVELPALAPLLVRLEDRVGRGGNAHGAHELLGEGLAPLDARRGGTGAEGGDAGCPQRVAKTCDERSLRADDGQVGREGSRERHAGRDVAQRQRSAGQLASDAGVAGSDGDGPALGAQAGGQGVLARARAVDQGLHRRRT